jgi:hypothetical protein
MVSRFAMVMALEWQGFNPFVAGRAHGSGRELDEQRGDAGLVAGGARAELQAADYWMGNCVWMNI